MIKTEGMNLGRHLKDPLTNIKSYFTDDTGITLIAENMNKFTDWGIVELVNVSEENALINVSIDSGEWGWFATGQIALEKDGQIIFSDNFQSGLKGPVGNALKSKSYAI